MMEHEERKTADKTLLVCNCHEPWVYQLGVLGYPLDIVSGFLSDNPRDLQHYARILLEDRDLAELMGRQARKTVAERFSPTRFKHAFLRSIEIARRKWCTRKVDPASLPRGSIQPVLAGR